MFKKYTSRGNTRVPLSRTTGQLIAFYSGLGIGAFLGFIVRGL